MHIYIYIHTHIHTDISDIEHCICLSILYTPYTYIMIPAAIEAPQELTPAMPSDAEEEPEESIATWLQLGLMEEDILHHHLGMVESL